MKRKKPAEASAPAKPRAKRKVTRSSAPSSGDKAPTAEKPARVEVLPREEEDLRDQETPPETIDELTSEAPEAEDREFEQEEWEEPAPEEIESNLPAVRPGPHETSLAETHFLDGELGSSAVHDPFRRYLEEIRRYPLLPPEEEFRLAIRLKNEGDMQAARTLVSANLRLVVKIALEYRTYYSNLLDLIQEGNIGLMKAVSKFDPTRGARLGYYASWWIRSYILKYLLDNFRLVKIGTTQAQKKLFYHLMREKERLEAQGLLTGPKLLAEKLHVREKDVVEMEQRLSGRGAEMSLDSPLNQDSGASSHMELLADDSEGADDQLARGELLKLLSQKLPEFQATLNDKEQFVLKERILAEEPKTLQEVADAYGLTRERARQIEAKVISKLREYLKPAL